MARNSSAAPFQKMPSSLPLPSTTVVKLAGGEIVLFDMTRPLAVSTVKS